jgi:hypothetical protein
MNQLCVVPMLFLPLMISFLTLDHCLFLRVASFAHSDPALFVDAHRMPDFFEDEVVALESALAISSQ